MVVTIKYNQPIGDYKAVERTEVFKAISYWKPEGTELVYFRLDAFNIKCVGVNEIVSID